MSEIEIEIDVKMNEKEKMLSSLRNLGIKVKSSCNGQGSCGDCVVKILQGMESLNRPTFNETRMLGNVFHITKERLSCQCYLENPSQDTVKIRVKNT